MNILTQMFLLNNRVPLNFLSNPDPECGSELRIRAGYTFLEVYTFRTLPFPIAFVVVSANGLHTCTDASSGNFLLSTIRNSFIISINI